MTNSAETAPGDAVQQPAGRKGGRLRKEGWEPRFLKNYAEFGSKSEAAKVAGVSARTVRSRELESAAFAEQLREAHDAFLDRLEADLVRLGRDKNNVIAILARLKAEMPAKYHEKMQLEGVLKTLSVSAVVPLEQAQALLREMLSDVTEATRRQLAAAPLALAETVDAVVVAAPAATETA